MARSCSPVVSMLVRSAALALTLVAGLVAAPVQAQDTPAAQATAAEPKLLLVGQPAPGIQVEGFVKGSPITSFESGKIYIVEFWATWCGPCIKAFPHLSQLQEDYGDKIKIIGVNIWEGSGSDPYTPEIRTKVEKFVEKQAEKMAYTVAFDGGTKWMDKNYMQAAQQNGIPAAFIVNGDGVVAWLGHPGGMDDVLKEVVEGTWDIAAAAKKINPAIQNAGKIRPIMMKLSDAWKAEEWDSVEKHIGEIAAISPDDALGPAMGNFNRLMKTDTAKAAAFMSPMVDGMFKDNAQALNAIAWTIVDPASEMEPKDLGLAMKAANRAVELEPKEASILDTLARVHFVKGDKAKAIELQEKAIALAATTEEKNALTAALDEYKNAK
jgi:thiol-disulfide isomerase/thioredoxin